MSASTRGDLGPGLLVHEWIARVGGSEQVLDRLSSAFPDSEILCLWDETDGDRYPDRTVHQTWIAGTPLRKSKPLALPLMPVIWRGAGKDLDYHWLLASSHVFAHQVRARPGTIKMAYVHTPARYVWAPELDKRGARWTARAASPLLRTLDRARAQELDTVIANSEFVRDRIRRAWGVDAQVVYPPVDVQSLVGVDWASRLSESESELLATLPRPFILGASRFIEYKRLDLVIGAGARLGMPTVIAGGGPQAAALRKLASESGSPVTFIDNPSDPLLFALYQQAIAYVFPAIEDFGIMPIEAMAVGTPVVARNLGGTRESVLRASGGALFEEPSARSVADAVQQAISHTPPSVDQRVSQFDSTRFETEMRAVVSDTIGSRG